MALTTWPNIVDSMRGQIQETAWFAKGIGTNEWYAVEVDPVTGAIPVSAVISLTYDTNYGVVGANTLRTAAQIGNATGAAAFNTGNVSAQTLRVVIATDQTAYSVNVTNLPAAVAVNTGAPDASTLRTVISSRSEAAATPLSTRLSDGSAFLGSDFGVSTAALRVAAVLGNASGALVYNTGNASAQTLRVVLATDQPTVPVSIAGTVTISGTVAATQSGSWVVGQSGTWNVGVTNLPTTVDTNSGAAGASTIRTVISTRSEAAATPLSTRVGDGTNFALTSNLTAAQQTLSTGNALAVSKSLAMGWDGAVHREIAVDTAGNLATTGASRNSVDLIYYDYVGGTVTTAAYTQIIAATSAASTRIQIFDSSGQGMILARGAAASEVDFLYIEPGGPGSIDVAIGSGVRLSLKAKTNDASVGFFMATSFT